MKPTIQMDKNQLNKMRATVESAMAHIDTLDVLTERHEYMAEKCEVLLIELEEGSYDDITLCDFFELARWVKIIGLPPLPLINKSTNYGDNMTNSEFAKKLGDTKIAENYYNAGGCVEMETTAGVWIVIHNPEFLPGINYRIAREG